MLTHSLTNFSIITVVEYDVYAGQMLYSTIDRRCVCKYSLVKRYDNIYVVYIVIPFDGFG
jgi:hypothetical protein